MIIFATNLSYFAQLPEGRTYHHQVRDLELLETIGFYVCIVLVAHSLYSVLIVPSL